MADASMLGANYVWQGQVADPTNNSVSGGVITFGRQTSASGMGWQRDITEFYYNDAGDYYEVLVDAKKGGEPTVTIAVNNLSVISTVETNDYFKFYVTTTGLASGNNKTFTFFAYVTAVDYGTFDAENSLYTLELTFKQNGGITTTTAAVSSSSVYVS